MLNLKCCTFFWGGGIFWEVRSGWWLDANIRHGWGLEEFKLLCFLGKQFKCSVSSATIFFPLVQKAFISETEKWNIMVCPQSIRTNSLTCALYHTERCPAGLLFSLGVEKSRIQMPVKKVLNMQNGFLRYVNGHFRLVGDGVFTERRKLRQVAPASNWSCKCCAEYLWEALWDCCLKLPWARVKVMLWLFKFLGLFLAHSLSCQSCILNLLWFILGNFLT